MPFTTFCYSEIMFGSVGTIKPYLLFNEVDEKNIYIISGESKT